MRINEVGNVGINTIVPKHRLSIVGSSTISDSIFNIVSSIANKNRSNALQASDTSSFSVKFTKTGKLVLDIKDEVGVTIFAIDSLHNITSNPIKVSQLSCALTDDTPTASELTSCAGSAVTAGTGKKRTVKDSNGSGKLYIIESDGTDWLYTVMTKSL